MMTAKSRAMTKQKQNETETKKKRRKKEERRSSSFYRACCYITAPGGIPPVTSVR
jgi:hypothetical protein